MTTPLARAALAALWIAAGPATLPAADAPKADAGAKAAFEIKMDCSEVPEMKEWAEQAKAAMEKCYPLFAEQLKSDGFTPPRVVTVKIKNRKDGIAGTGGSHIEATSEWFKKRPEDTGALIHELAHVIQSYPKYHPVWLVEGIADYMRFWKYEPESKRPKLNPDRIKYQDGYQPVGAFLAWLEMTYDKDIVKKLNAACRETRYKDELFQDCTKKTLDELWNEFKESLRKK
jgi:hypothetical protein